MKKKLLVVVLLGLMVRTAAAQDAKAVLQAASTAMGTANVKSVQYSGTGYNTAMGQNFSVDADWPKFEVTSYTRTIDYTAQFSKEEITRRQGSYAGRGGGGTPLQGDQHLVSIVSGTYAWNLQGTEVRPAPETADVRRLEILLTPHGFIKAAMAATDAKAASFTVAGRSEAGMTQGGRRMTIVSFTALGKYRVNGTINDQNMVEMVQTWIPNPVLGDMLYESRSTEYREFGGAKFPTFLHQHMGNFRLTAGHDYMEIKMPNVQANVSVAPVAIPDAVRQATIPPVRVESQKLADGVWLVGGGTHNSVAVEFRDFVAVVEAPLNEDRSVAVIGEVHKLIPGKTIQYVVNTHHHFDHSGGLRTYVAEGVTVVTQQSNRDFYQDVVFYPAPRILQPDRLATFYPTFTNARKEAIEVVTPRQKYVLSDGVRTMDLYPVEGLAHAAGMLLAYLPKEKILVNADLYSPPATGAQPPATPTPTMVSLYQNIQRLKLDVTQHVPIHGQPGTMDEFLKIVGKPGTN